MKIRKSDPAPDSVSYAEMLESNEPLYTIQRGIEYCLRKSHQEYYTPLLDIEYELLAKGVTEWILAQPQVEKLGLRVAAAKAQYREIE